jgi:hypothetical protein
MNLYKATYSTVIYTETVNAAVSVARELVDEFSPFAYEEESVQEILCADDVPSGWEESFCPITNEQGAFGKLSIKQILRNNEGSFALKKRIKELEAELKELKSQSK